MSDAAHHPAGEAQRSHWDALRAALAAQRAGPPLRPRATHSPAPASFGQQRLWFLERLDPGTPVHILTVAHDLSGPLDAPALEHALTELVRRHDILRTTFLEADDGVVQCIHPPGRVGLNIEDLRGFDAQTRQTILQDRSEAETSAPFDLRQGPLLRARLLRLADEEHRLLVSVHHAIFDGWSFEIFMDELCRLYGAFAQGEPSPLPAPGLQFADVAGWQRQRLQGPALDALLAYWVPRFEPLPPILAFPTDRPRRLGRDRRGASRRLDLGAELTQALTAFSEREGVTLFTTLVAGFQLLLQRHTGNADMVIGSPVANRNRAEFRQMLGFFTNILPLRIRQDEAAGFRALLRHVAEVVDGAIAHQELPFEILVEAVNPPRMPRHPPLVQVVFAFQNLPRTGWTWPGLRQRSQPLDSRRAEHELTLYVQRWPTGLAALLHYDSSLFDAATMDALLASFAVLLGAAIAAPEQPVATLPLLTAQERRRALAACPAGAAHALEADNIPGAFAAQLRRTPEMIAIRGDDDAALTYRELDAQAEQLARQLRAQGVLPGARVGISLARSPRLIVALLAVLKAGGCYVPFDPATPSALLHERLRQCEAGHLLVEGDARGEPAPGGVVVQRVDGGGQALDAPASDADALACVMFTSGSTGGPKAVGVTHRGIVRLALDNDLIRPTAKDTVLHMAPIAFDAASFEIWGALLNGATLALAPPDAAAPELLGNVIRRHGVTLLWLTSGLSERVMDLRPDALAPLQRLIVGGDVVSPAHAGRFLAAAPKARLINGYGPTENTTFTCLHPIAAAECDGEAPLPIGRPVAGTRVHVLDAALEPVPRGVIGEACLSGEGLARGYLNDPALTCARFVPHPFDLTPGARLYRSGDLVRQRADGVLEFHGRMDGQIKIRGMRVELAEVEAALMACPGVARAAIVVEGIAAGDKRLVGYVVAQPGADPLPALPSLLRARLPDAMMPSLLMELGSLPLTSHGKLDRAALPAPAAAPSAEALPRQLDEAILLDLFAAVLDRAALGIHDNFFDAGGHSLLAVELMLRIEELFGVELPLIALFETPTVAGLTQRLRDCEASAADPHPAGLVTLRRGDRTRPIFLFPGGYGGMVEMAHYGRALRRLPGTRAIHGLRSRGMAGTNPLPDGVAGLVAAHISAMRAAQPHGPYLLVGECVGGAVALEAAQQLVAQGEAVARLILLDSWCPSAAAQRHYEWIERPRDLARNTLLTLRGLLRDWATAWRHEWQGLAAAAWPDRPPRARVAAAGLLRIAADLGPRMARIGAPQPGHSKAAERAYRRALMAYRPRPYPGPVTLIASAHSLGHGIAEDWRRWAGGGLTVLEVPGDHESYLREHAAAALRQLSASLPPEA